MEQNELKDILGLFDTEGSMGEIKPLGEGLINDTYLARNTEAGKPDYVLQRVNENVFPDVDMVMRNIQAVTSHIRRKLEAQGMPDIDRRVLRFIPVRETGKLYTVAGGKYWRVMVFIPNAITKQAVNAESSQAAGLAFGQFQSMLADLPVRLGETIKDFHNMEFRLRQLREVLAADPCGRAMEPRVQEMLAVINDRAEEMCKAERMGREGILPKRVCHCDTKVNNMLFDDHDNVLCVIDLDTVMPNFIFSDYAPIMWPRTAPTCRRWGSTWTSSAPSPRATSREPAVSSCLWKSRTCPTRPPSSPSCSACASCGTTSAATSIGSASTPTTTSTGPTTSFTSS